MTTCSRKSIFLEDQVATYHLISRCVRRAFLCGEDSHTKKNYDHRRAWVEDRLKHLTNHCYFIDVVSFVTMTNHLHLVVTTRQDTCSASSDEDIVKRWWNLYPLKINGVYSENPPEDLVIIWLSNPEWIQERRRRLCSISKLMASLCEYIARKANKEDDVTGRFWEGRFKSQALVDQKCGNLAL